MVLQRGHTFYCEYVCSNVLGRVGDDGGGGNKYEAGDGVGNGNSGGSGDNDSD